MATFCQPKIAEDIMFDGTLVGLVVRSDEALLVLDTEFDVTPGFLGQASETPVYLWQGPFVTASRRGMGSPLGDGECRKFL